MSENGTLGLRADERPGFSVPGPVDGGLPELVGNGGDHGIKAVVVMKHGVQHH